MALIYSAMVRDFFMRELARKINNKGPGRVTGLFPSVKLGRMVEWDSQIERDYLYYLEFDDDVIEYSEQPIKFKYTLNHRYRDYYPDFEIRRMSTSRLKYVEIKKESKLKNDEIRIKYSAIASAMAEAGHDFELVTEKSLRVEPRYSNLTLLNKYYREEADPVLVAKVKKDVKAFHLSPLTLGDLTSFEYLNKRDCYVLIANRVFSFDLDTKLDDNISLKLR